MFYQSGRATNGTIGFADEKALENYYMKSRDMHYAVVFKGLETKEVLPTTVTYTIRFKRGWR